MYVRLFVWVIVFMCECVRTRLGFVGLSVLVGVCVNVSCSITSRGGIALIQVQVRKKLDEKKPVDCKLKTSIAKHHACSQGGKARSAMHSAVEAGKITLF